VPGAATLASAGASEGLVKPSETPVGEVPGDCTRSHSTINKEGTWSYSPAVPFLCLHPLWLL
jgi:hypothetical protein